MERGRAVSCPVCDRLFSLQTINSHIDACLQRSAGPVKERSRPEPASSSGSGDSEADAGQGAAFRRGTKRKIEGSPPASAEGSGSKQSTLTFGKRKASERETAWQEHPPPTKNPRLDTLKNSFCDTPDKAVCASSHVADQVRRPLAEAMRPKSIEGYVGQEAMLGRDSLLKTALESGQVPSLIFWGPPGCGKVRVPNVVHEHLLVYLVAVYHRSGIFRP